MRVRTMILLSICCILVAFLKNTHSHGKPAPVADSLYMVIYSTGPGWIAGKSFGEQVHASSHNAFMQQLRKDSVTKLGARYADKGMLVIKSATLAAARKLIDADPAIISQTFRAEIYPVNFFYKGCIEK